MLCGLFLKELTIPALGDDFHRIILRRRLVESMSKCFLDDRTQ
jgi:hypothetical protein